MCRGGVGPDDFMVWICSAAPPAVAKAVWGYLDPLHLIIPVHLLEQRLFSDDDAAIGRCLRPILSLGIPSKGSQFNLAAALSCAPMVIILDDNPKARPSQPSHPPLRLLQDLALILRLTSGGGSTAEAVGRV